MNRYSFLHLDVFTRQPFGGNQLAVFTDGRGLTREQMQELAREMNFSQTTFVLPAENPGADCKVHIFTPAVEIPMAGHPTVGTVAALVQRGLVKPSLNGTLTLEMGIGLVKVEIKQKEGCPPFVWMNHQLPQFVQYERSREAVARGLGLREEELREDLPLEIVSTGMPFLFVPLVSLNAIGRARSDRNALAHLFEGMEPAHVALFTDEVSGPPADVHARMYSPHLAGISEDSATGAMAAPFGAYLARYGVLPEQRLATFTIEQGLEIHRPSLITVEVGRVAEEITSLRIGGDSVIIGEGEIYWE